MNAFDNLINQIDAFIRKYYKNEMLKGGILFTGFLLLSYLLVIILEYFGRFSSGVRAFLFFGFILVNLFIFTKYFFIPLLKLVSFGKRIDRYQASKIIGTFFPDISDRLLNTLQLNDDLSNNDANYELIRASVNQRSQQLNAVPFTSGINLKDNLIYLKYVVPVALVFILIASLFPNILKQGTERVVNYQQEFKPEAPFDFVLNSSLQTLEEGEDYNVELTLKGKQLPENVYIVSSQGKFLMNKTSKVNSSYVLRKLKENTSFYFEANGFRSDSYHLNITPKSSIGRFQATLTFPAYLGRKQEVVTNAGDLEIPEGTFVEWNVMSKNTDKVSFKISDSLYVFKDESFKLKKRFKNSAAVNVLLSNRTTKKKDSLTYQVSVIKDAFPFINANETIDSLSDGIRYFSGQISDDYGLSNLYFNYTIISENGKKRENRLQVTKTFGTEMPFTYAFDFRNEQLKVKDKIEYYFVVYDNDGVNGSKASKSQVFSYSLPSLEELNTKRDEAQEQSKKELNDLIKRTNEFQKNIQKLKKEMMNSKNSDWNKMNQLNQIKEEQMSLEKAIEQMQQQMNSSLDEKNQLSELDKELMEKQDMLQDLLDKVMDDELKNLLKELEDLMKKNDKYNLDNKLEKLDMKSEDMKKQLDRSMELLKKLQVNEKIDDIEKQLKSLAEEQKELKDKISENKLTKEQAVEKQNDINDKFEQLKDDLDKLKELNDELKRPMDLGDQEQLKKEITDQLNQSKENLQKGKNSKAGDNQKKSAEGMEKMAQELDSKQAGANAKQNEEDINSLRMILENLLTLSFNQESTMLSFAKTKSSDPYFRKLARDQRRLIDDSKIVADSLNALALRQPQLASFLDKELSTIQQNFDYAILDMGERRSGNLQSRLQYVMTSFNNLALMLNESLQQMQQQMNSQMNSSGSCDNPGGSGKGKSGKDPADGDMKEMLKKQLEQMKKGEKPGGSKPGDKGEDGEGMPGLSNKEIAKMVAQQAAIRQRLEEMRKELNKDGKGTGNKLNPLINELEKQERDLLNKNFSRDMIRRQQDILSRLLESEKAMMERGFDEKRESKAGKDLKYSNQIKIDEYNQQKLKQVELLRSIDPTYSKYYKDKANEYFNIVL